MDDIPKAYLLAVVWLKYFIESAKSNVFRVTFTPKRVSHMQLR